MKQPNLPTIQDGNTETRPTTRAITRYIIEEMKQRRCTEQDAVLNSFCFLAGHFYARGVTLFQMGFILFDLWRITTGQRLRKLINNPKTGRLWGRK